MEIVIPRLSSDTYKLIGFFLILPTVFMPLRMLSIPSVMSTLATVVLVAIVVFDGFYKTKAPGSIMDPAPTRMGPETYQLNWLGSVGLVLAGFGGHAVIPSVARDMKKPESCDRIFNIAFVSKATTTRPQPGRLAHGLNSQLDVVLRADTAVHRRGHLVHFRRGRLPHDRRRRV